MCSKSVIVYVYDFVEDENSVMTSSRVTNDYGGLALPKKRQQTRFPLGGESKSVIVYVYDSIKDKNTAITYLRVTTNYRGLTPTSSGSPPLSKNCQHTIVC